MGKLNKILTVLCVVFGSFLVLLVFYYVITFTNIPIISTLRDTWIETAMTTADHQWLATKFFPKTVVDKIMAKQVTTDDNLISDPNVVVIAPRSTPTPTPDFDDETAIDVIAPVDIDDDWPKVGDKDEQGNKYIVADKEQDIRIVEIGGFSLGDGGNYYKGQILFVSDPSRVVVRHTDAKDVRGELMSSYLEKYDAIAGVNANGFGDAEGKGTGGLIIGWSIADGKLWGNRETGLNSASAGFTNDDILVVGSIKKPQDYPLRDMVQWGPVLIADGKRMISGSAGWGCQPRTAIGQTADGTVVLVTVDGRQLHSAGITVGELADILFSYGVVNACLCDGGSSSVMMYDSAIVGSVCTPMKTTGRYLPNAILVLRK
ncbi:MAG: phosphodiester glycosidase family protein [Oscillospiraceae bacterium]|jgi:exopolysaccharide biosynthesis protein|nr:phosphodiester glycosidase family protein [Oscillospiraceae bacterium]